MAAVATVADLAHDFRRFRGDREVLRALRRRIREPVPAVRRAVRRRALDTLPSGGGLGAWVAASRVNVSVRVSSPLSAGIRLVGGRNSAGGRSDMRAIDAGRVRAPSWGRRTSGAWHVQAVPAGWFTRPAGEVDQWRAAAAAAVDDAVATLGGG